MEQLLPNVPGTIPGMGFSMTGELERKALELKALACGLADAGTFLVRTKLALR